MDAKTREQNLKDLKLYRLIIAFVFILVIAIALIIGKVTINSYSADAYFTNNFLNLLMEKQITSIDEIDGKHLTFTREINKDYDVEKDQPVDAFTYYLLSDDGSKVALDHGVYYPASYYMENSDTTPVQVAAGFLLSAQKNVRIFTNVMTVIAVLIGLAFLAFLIYFWYRSWCKREEERVAMYKNK